MGAATLYGHQWGREKSRGQSSQLEGQAGLGWNRVPVDGGGDSFLRAEYNWDAMGSSTDALPVPPDWDLDKNRGCSEEGIHLT